MYPPGSGVTFAMLPLNGQNGDLEFSTYAMLVGDHLSRLGYTKVDDLANARILVALAYSINGRTLQSAVPVFGQESKVGAPLSKAKNGVHPYLPWKASC
jgi:hypothetical protein